MSVDFILNDVSRCNNHKCPIRAFCSRYRQLAIDFKKYKEENGLPEKAEVAYKVLSIIPVARFNDQNKALCDHFINVEP